jgi:hypothetical protein
MTRHGKRTALTLLREIQARNPGPHIKTSVLPGRPTAPEQAEADASLRRSLAALVQNAERTGVGIDTSTLRLLLDGKRLL